MAWFAIRNVYHFRTKPDGTHLYEERVVCFEAPNAEEAHRIADEESRQYAVDNSFTCHRHQVGYELDDDRLVHGHEVWSTMYQSNLGLDAFYRRYYEERAYVVEADGTAESM